MFQFRLATFQGLSSPTATILDGSPVRSHFPRAVNEAELIAVRSGSCSKTEPAGEALQISPIPYRDLHP